jgi:hypothetical protein
MPDDVNRTTDPSLVFVTAAVPCNARLLVEEKSGYEIVCAVAAQAKHRITGSDPNRILRCVAMASASGTGLSVPLLLSAAHDHPGALRVEPVPAAPPSMIGLQLVYFARHPCAGRNDKDE